MPGEARSAVIVALAVPAAVESIRRRNVPVATAGVPPHVTILSPFVPTAQLGPAVRARLAVAIGAATAFDVRFESVGRFPDALYLEPDPAQPFRELIVAVCEAFPALPPYGDPALRPRDIEPHLTIAIGDGSGFDALAAAVGSVLPVSRRVAAVTVVAEGGDGRWRTRWRLPLRS